MQGFYFSVKFGLVLIFILKVYRKKIHFGFFEKKYVQFFTCIFLLKNMYFLKFWKISLLKSIDKVQYFSLEIFLWALFFLT